MKQPQPPTFAARVGRATTELRERARLTKQELAEHLGVDPKIVRNIEDGLHPQTCGQHLDRLAEIFRVGLERFVRKNP